MHDSERILSAVGDISDDKIEAASRTLGYKWETTTRGTVHSMRKIVSIIAAAALIAALGAAAYAIGVHSDFFNNAFGTGVPGQEAKTVELRDKDGNLVTTESYPAVERVAVDEEEAEVMVGAYVTAVGQSAQIGDFTFTVREVTIDENGNGTVAVDVDNPKGHGRKADGNPVDGQADTWFGYSVEGSGGAMIASHDYAVTEGYSNEHISFVCSLNYGMSAPAEAEDIILSFEVYSGENDRQTADIIIPAAECIPAKEFSCDGASAAVSPVGMTLHIENALSNVEYVPQEMVIHYSDGGKYTVQGENVVNYMCSVMLQGEDNGTFNTTFNRLVDTDAISEITVKATYRLNGEMNELYYSLS